MDQRGETATIAHDDEWVELGGALGNGLSLRVPVAVHLWHEAGEFVADVPDLHVYAFGSTRDEAVGNLRLLIVDQYRRFTELGDRLASPAQPVAQRFRDLVIPGDA